MRVSFGEQVSPAQSGMRVGILAALVAIAVGLRAIDPTSLSGLPFHTSCGAITGLPCVFCGTTRAMHQLLNGNFARALYFNWLSFPVAFFAAGLGAKFAAEIILRRRLNFGFPPVRFTPRLAAVSAITILALWFLQVSLAVSLHKRELLNPNGVLYGLVVR